MRFSFRALAAALAILLLAAVLPLGAEAAGSPPVIALTRTPAYGDRAAFQGVVYTEDGSRFDPGDYRITLYLQLTEGGTYWVKPTYATPYAEIDPDGTFLIEYVTGGYDEEARILHIMLIPSDYTPASDYEDARARALDYVRVERTEQGTVTVSPQRYAPDYGEAGKPSGLSVSPDMLAVDVGFYTHGRPGDPLSRQQIAKQLDTVADYADTVRFYQAGGAAAPAYEIAHTLGLSVIGNAWLSGDEAADRAEMDALIEHCNRGYVSVACVGSETLLRGDLTAEELVADMEYVRERLDDSSIPVTTADSAGMLLKNYPVRAACDLLMPNCYPYWEGTEIGRAMESFASTMTALRTASPGKELIVSETGWPSAGGTVRDARAGEAEAAQYFSDIRDWSLDTGTLVLWFDVADEPWKSADEGEAGAHWGLMDTELNVKEAFAGTDFFRRTAARIGQHNFKRINPYLTGMFRDVAQGVWYAANVRAVYEYGLMVGVADDRFNPEGPVRVSELVTLACRLHDTWHHRRVSHESGGRWYDGYVNYALAAGILRPGQFSDFDCPAARSEVAEVLAASLPREAFPAKYPEKTAPDITGREDYGKAVLLLYQAGILDGYDGEGSFAPDRTVTRAETAAIATRIADISLRL